MPKKEKEPTAHEELRLAPEAVAEQIELDPPQVRVFSINEDQSIIKGGQVFVSVTEFLTIEDRDRHTARHPIMHLMAASVHEAIAQDHTLQNTLYPLVQRILLQEQMLSSIAEFEPLIPFGFDPSWILQPIRIVGDSLIPTGNFDPQPITRQFLINQLQCAVGHDICNCR
ncbi:MAG: hypothetical protein FWE03_00420 [Firmicutes bacterium]|nr:hypothetical protein [Bacillota bacterium]